MFSAFFRDRKNPLLYFISFHFARAMFFPSDCGLAARATELRGPPADDRSPHGRPLPGRPHPAPDAAVDAVHHRTHSAHAGSH